jgi:hypothetical protein
MSPIHRGGTPPSLAGTRRSCAPGAAFGSLRVTSDIVTQDVRTLDVTGAVQEAGGLSLKIEPACTPAPGGGGW